VGSCGASRDPGFGRPIPDRRALGSSARRIRLQLHRNDEGALGVEGALVWYSGNQL